MKTSHRLGVKCLKNISDKGFVCKIYKELFIFSKKKTQLKLKKKKIRMDPTNEDVYMANKHMKRCSRILTIYEKMLNIICHSELQIRTT